MSALNNATIRQIQAAEPDASTWLSANAGSGKTRVLTDRVARLLLNEVDPQNILCLTYTKAAASEMQNRLFMRLGEWSMMPDAQLTEELGDLGVALPVDELVRARRLFAQAIETPGGLRIQTIHSFCASLLRRFPLEAGISPRFTEMDDRSATLLRDEILEAMAAGDARDAIDGIAAHLSGDDLGDLTKALAQHREALMIDARREDVLAWFGLAPDADARSIVQAAFDGTESALATRVQAIARTQTASYAKFGELLAGLDLEYPGFAEFETLCGLFLYASGDNQNESKSVNFPQSNHKKAVAAFDPVLPELHAFMDRVAAAKDQELSLLSAERTLALYAFAHPFLDDLDARKQTRGWLDFDDLIQKASALLNDERVAGWVLYRLDGGLDHILVDEAQDTSPAQWTVIKCLAQEFTSGLGARDGVPRSIFVVGDKKQSIYSFQGADPREFDRMQRHFKDRLNAVGVSLRPMELEYSFRSSQAILRVVDQVISNANMPNLEQDARHLAFHGDMPGRVDVWAAVPKTEAPAKHRWFDPVDILSEDHHDVILARKIANQIKTMIGTETIPAEDGNRRAVRAGDILVLVRRRSRLFEEVIRACKTLKLPVAGADRLRLGGELAVKDLSALLSFVATPEDDLSLAAALRSPLFGWTEAQLYDLAAGRIEPYLWAALRNREDQHPETIKMLQDLRDKSDYLRPYDLIERILTRHDGRRRLLARLGPEAEDGIDSLLQQALSFERMEVPSLTGFLVWMETDDVEVKRQMDNAGDLIRVMTVHGAKGLESPIVILPDTAKQTVAVRAQIVPLDIGKLVWKPVSGQQPESVKSSLASLKSADSEEAMRLLYVAMTRAETWLIIAVAGDVGNPGESWYQLLSRAATEMGSVPFNSPTGAGLRYEFGDWAGGPLVEAPVAAIRSAEMPEWADAKVEARAKPAGLLSPSDLGGAKALYLDGAPLDTEAAMRTGRQMHRLLEHLPGAPPANWEDLAIAVLATGEDSAGPDEANTLLRGLRPVLEAEDLQFLFGELVLPEVGITASLPEMDGARISGTIDRLIVSPERIMAVDFKTNAVVPDTAEAVPDGILRQMGAYLAALRQVYPDCPVEVAILWTQTASLMPLPNDIVMKALQRTATS